MLTVILRWNQKRDLIETLVNNILKILFIFFIFSGCSLDRKENSVFYLWDKENKVKEESQAQLDKTKEIFKKKEILSKEFNPDLRIKLYSKLTNNSSKKNFDNNNGRINYNGNLKSISKYKFKKIENFYQYEPEIIFNQNNIIFFDNKGAILNFDSNSNLIWKKNYYSKVEKKQKPILFFAHNEKTLIITDNIAKFYALNINTGELLWTKKNTAPFNSQIKIYKDKFYVIDFKNTLRAYSIKDGKEIWKKKTQDSLIRSQKKLSLVIIKEKIYFNNSLGDISAVDINSGNLIWQTPTQSNLIFDKGFFLKTSDIVANDQMLFFSNNQNEFFSLDIQTGNLNWKQEINSTLRPTIINNFIFTVSSEGYLIVIEKKSGNIIRINDIFKGPKKNFFSTKKGKTCQKFLSSKNVPCESINPSSKKEKRSKVKPSGFIMGKEKIYLSTNNGRLLVIDINSGKVKSTLKIDSKKISRPTIVNKNLFVISDDSIIKLN